MSNDTVVFIPARGGSKRIPRKNICDLNNFPLISYTITFSLIGLHVPTYVSTEDPQIAAISKLWGAKVIDRPEELAKDDSLDIDWIRHAISCLPKTPKKILLLRTTTPLRNLKIVKEAIKSFTKNYSSLRSVEVITEAIEKTLRLRDGLLHSAFNDEKKSLAPNQSFETSYKANGYIDILRPECIRKNKTIYGNRCFGFVTPRTAEIDTPEDLEYAKFLLQKHSHI